MILKFSLLSAAGVTLLSSSTTNAFCTTVPSSRRTFPTVQLHSSLDRDWDNGDFLSSLSGGAQDIAEANAKYEALSESKAKMNEWRARQMQMQLQQQSSAPRNENSDTINESGDYGPSPELLRKMMGESDDDLDLMRQQPAGQLQQSAQVQQAAVPPPPPQQPQMPQQQQFYDANGNPVDAPMFYDANGNLLSFFPPPPPQQVQPVMDSTQTLQQHQPEQSMEPINQATTLEPDVPSLEPVEWEPPLPSNPKTRGDEPRPQGYNADAYAVSNTADVYFAQLKQDSRVRKRAWLAGDRETANQVFTDPSVAEIKDSWVDNPYTKEKNIQEARAEIEGAVRMQQGDDGDSKSTTKNSGISYKQKLEEVKAKRRTDGVV